VNKFAVAILEEMRVLITELAESALAVISPLNVATLALILVLITELAESALAVISPLNVAT
jgi:hypothetical protein